MRLVNIEDFAAGTQSGKTAVLKALEKWQRDHPITEFVIENMDTYDITINCKENRIIIKEKEK